MFGAGKNERDREAVAGWVCISGLRYLRATHPLKAEHDFVQEIYRQRKLLEMIAAGEIPASGTHNIVRKSVWGIKKRVTILPEQGAGRTWPSTIPPEFAGSPTLEIPGVDLGSTHYVRDIIAAFTRAIPSKLGDPSRKILAEIEKESQSDLSLSDLNSLAPQPSSDFAAIVLGQQASALMDLLDHMAPLYESPGSADPALIPTYWKNISESYGYWLLDTRRYASLLVAIEVIRAAYPIWPLGSGLPRFVCGRLECRHRLCRLRKEYLYRSTPLPAVLGASLASRDIWSYFSQNRITLDSFLNDVLAAGSGRQWILQAAEKLYKDSKVVWDSLRDAPTVINFYHRHFLNVGFAQAAELAYQKLSETASSTEDRSSAEYFAKEMEESLARSVAALWFDFTNSLRQSLNHPRLATTLARMARAVADLMAHAGINHCRTVYSETAQQSNTAAEISLDKWLYNEALFPVFWQEFVRGTIDTLPILAPAKNSRP